MSDINTYELLSLGLKVSRKQKLAWLGRKKTKKKIRSLINGFLENSENKSCPVCENCGSLTQYTIVHDVEYPEIFEEDFCLRCRTLVSYRDNSRTRYVVVEKMDVNSKEILKMYLVK